MRIIYIIFLFCFFFSKPILSQKISVVNIQSLIDNNIIYINTLTEINNNRKKLLEKFEIREKELNKIFNEIENSKLILNENEINNQIDNYNLMLKNFTNLVDEFNYHYQNQILIIREKIFKKIIKILEDYATNNNVELILDSTSYLIASNSLDITEQINKELEKIDFRLEYKDFEKN